LRESRYATLSRAPFLKRVAEVALHLSPFDWKWFAIEAQMKFGVFDHMDNSGVPLGQQSCLTASLQRLQRPCTCSRR